MPWQHTPADRRRDSANYGATYRRNRQLALRRDKWQCQLRLPGICRGAATETDHITQPAQGGTHAVENLRAVCSRCHAVRTQQQAASSRTTPAKQDPKPKPTTLW